MTYVFSGTLNATQLLGQSINRFLSQVATNASIYPLIEIAKQTHANFLKQLANEHHR